MKRIKSFAKNYKYSIPTAIVILLVLGFLFTRGGGEVKAETIDAQRGTVSQEVTVTGRVVPAEDAELAVQSGGKVTSIPVKVGQQVTAGQTLLRVDSADLQIRLGRQQAALQKAQLALANQQPGAGNATDDLKKAYEDGFNTIADTFLDIPSITLGLDNILNDRNHSPHADQEAVRPYGQKALDMRAATVLAYNKANEKYDILFAKYKTFSRTASPTELESMLNETYDVTKLIADAVKSTRNFIDYIEDQDSGAYTSKINADQADLADYTQQTNTHLSALLNIKNTIKNARDAISTQTNNTESSSIDIRQAQLDIQDTLNQIANRTIKSPVAGLVTDIKVELGETISPSSPVISVISANQYEVEANIPEADVAKLIVGADTNITLDAYGSEVVFKAKVVSINPAETLTDGVATYKTTFQFVDTDDRIKSGMTANITIMGEKKENVIAVPQRSIITKNDVKYIQILVGQEIVEKEVQTGMRGSDGNIEVVSGISEGDKVVVFNQSK